MGRHRLFDRKRSGRPYWTVSPRGVMTLHTIIWFTPSGGLTTIPALRTDNHENPAL